MLKIAIVSLFNENKMYAAAANIKGSTGGFEYDMGTWYNT